MKKSVICVYGHANVQRIQDQPAVIDLSGMLLLCMENFAADTITSSMLLAFTRASHCELGHHTHWQAN